MNNNNVGLKEGFLRQHSVLFIRISSIIDSFIVFITLFSTLWLFGDSFGIKHVNMGLLAALLFVTIATLFALYRSWRVIRFRFEIIKIFFSWSISVVLLNFILFIIGTQDSISNNEIIVWFFSAFVAMSFVRYVARMITRYVRAFGYDVRQVAFIGATDTAVRMRNIYAEHTWMGMQSIGIYDDRQTKEDGQIPGCDLELSGSIEELIELAKDCSVDIVYVCMPLAEEKRIKMVIDLFSDTTVSIYYCPNFFDFDLMQSHWDEVFGQPVISVVESPFVDHHRYLKRIEDIVIIIGLLPFLIPLVVIVSLLVKLSSKGPVFFRQNRYGINGESFKMWKFRTMYIENCNETFSQVRKNDPRITRIGAFLRRTSLDEIPQFINVLSGEMSVVGPRPHPDIINEVLRKQIHRYMLRHKIKPGITGLAQVNGFRGETESLDIMEQRIEQDLQYIRQWSLLLDIKILIKTITCLSGNRVY